jgi:hypothetical protein
VAPSFRSAVVVFLLSFWGPALSEPAQQDRGEQQSEGKETSKPGLRLAYRDGFQLSTDDGRFSLRLTAGVQFRYSYVAYDPAVFGNQTDYSNFFLRRARLWWDGHAYDPRITYSFHLQLEPHGAMNLHDAWVEYSFHPLLRLGAGRNKIAYGLEFMAAAFQLNFIERSVMYGETDIDRGGGLSAFPDPEGQQTATFGLHEVNARGFPTGGLALFRSQGVQVQGRRESGARGAAFDYQAGIWQGRRSRGISNPDANHLYSVRAGFYPFGFISWQQQGDQRHTANFRAGLLASAYVNRSDFTRHNESGWNTAAVARYRGFSGDLEYGTERIELEAIAPGQDFNRLGWRASLGYFIRPGFLEAVGRYAAMERLRDPTPAGVNATGLGFARIWNPWAGEFQYAMERQIREVTGGFNVYLSRSHQHKLLFDVSRLTRTFEPHDGLFDVVAEPPGSPVRLERIFSAPMQDDRRLRAVMQLRF